MNEKRPLLRFGLGLLLLLAACTSQQDSPPLQGAKIGGPFSLVDQNGRTVTDRQFAGKYRIMYFGYTYCPDVCPVDLQNISQAVKDIEKSDPAKGARIQPLFISVDPARDTPQVMKQYVASFHPRLLGLTGTPDQVAAVAKEYGTYYVKENRPGLSEYSVNHSRVTLLMGPKGEPLAILPSDQGADAIAQELKRWVK